MSADANAPVVKRRLAIVGCGSSGLVTLKYALDALPDWGIVCFEKTDSITGCWGNPHPGFVSTSTKFTTQFACFALFDASVHEDGGDSRSEFFRDGEYGEYLEAFADAFQLRRAIRLSATVQNLKHRNSYWECEIFDGTTGTIAAESFDAVVICTGLAAKPHQTRFPTQPIPAMVALDVLKSRTGLEHIQDKRIVVLGGGESAVDYAFRLSKPELRNKVYLSLRSGIRVSPRYHPIRGVPSDFLRNRLMLSIHSDLRNWIGERFVALRIRYQEVFERFFPPPKRHRSQQSNEDGDGIVERRKAWAYRLTLAAKDDLFNMFHNKSDDFLDAIARGRIEVIGKPVDDGCRDFYQFESTQRVAINPDVLVPAIGFQSSLADISDEPIRIADFYLGCRHVTLPNLFLIGFARPIIGNIPSISEMQARYVCQVIAGQTGDSKDLAKRHDVDRDMSRKRYAALNLAAMYPVEMFPYCDRLAVEMGLGRDLQKRWRRQFIPASTMHYFPTDDKANQKLDTTPIYMPWTLIAFLLLLLPIDFVYRRLKYRSDQTEKT